MTAPIVTQSAIPAILELRQKPQWVCWCYEETKDGRRTKVPYNAHNGYNASTTNPKTWSTYEIAVKALQNIRTPDGRSFDGIGFVFNNDYTGIDCDHCIQEDGTIDEWALDIIRAVGSFAERSPNDGVHIFPRGVLPETLGSNGKLERRGRKIKLPGKRHPEAAIEMYCQGRFFTITGNHFAGTPDHIEDRQEAIIELYNTITQIEQKPLPPKKQQSPVREAAPAGPDDLTDDALIKKAMEAKNGHRFAALWRGDISDYQNDHSDADLALCNMLAFWTGKDAYRMDRLFRQSGLYRDDKWDRNARSGETYGQGTITRAINNCDEVYTGPTSINDIIYGPTQGGKSASSGGSGNNDRDTTSNGERPGPDPQFVIDCLHEGEYGDAHLFAYLFRGMVLYDHTAKEWYTWSGHWWEEDSTEKIKHLVSGKLASVYIKTGADLNTQASQQEAKAEASGDEQEKERAAQYVTKVKGLIKELSGRAFSLRQISRCKNVLNFASSFDGMGIKAAQWDRNPMLLAVPNGVIDLKTGLLRNGRPEDYIRTHCPTEWQGIDAPAPRWERFLKEIFELKLIETPDGRKFVKRTEQELDNLIKFMRRLFGYGITGEVAEHVFALLYGEDGRNGKDTIQHAISHAIGDVSTAISKDVLLDAGRARSAGAPTPHLSDLQGKRLAWASEPEKGARFSVGQVKEYSGGGEIPTRSPYEKKFTKIKPSHLLILLTNHKPHADANDEAFWDRLRLITFDMRFVDNPVEKKVNERKKDTQLWPELEMEAPGILAWLVRGCLEWQEQGLNTPQSVLDDGKRYRNEEDDLIKFLQECCITGEDKKVSASALYTAYESWARSGNLYIINRTVFGTQMGKKKFSKKPTNKGIVYLGLGLLSDTHSEGSVNSLKEPFTATEGAPQEDLGEYSEDKSEGCEQFKQELVKNQPHESQKIDKPVETIHTIHSTLMDSLINQPVEPSKGAVNTSQDYSPTLHSTDDQKFVPPGEYERGNSPYAFVVAEGITRATFEKYATCKRVTTTSHGRGWLTWLGIHEGVVRSGVVLDAYSDDKAYLFPMWEVNPVEDEEVVL